MRLAPDLMPCLRAAPHRSGGKGRRKKYLCRHCDGGGRYGLPGKLEMPSFLWRPPARGNGAGSLFPSLLRHVRVCRVGDIPRRALRCSCFQAAPHHRAAPPGGNKNEEAPWLNAAGNNKARATISVFVAKLGCCSALPRRTGSDCDFSRSLQSHRPVGLCGVRG